MPAGAEPIGARALKSSYSDADYIGVTVTRIRPLAVG